MVWYRFANYPKATEIIACYLQTDLELQKLLVHSWDVLFCSEFDPVCSTCFFFETHTKLTSNYSTSQLIPQPIKMIHRHYGSIKECVKDLENNRGRTLKGKYFPSSSLKLKNAEKWSHCSVTTKIKCSCTVVSESNAVILIFIQFSNSDLHSFGTVIDCWFVKLWKK